MNFRIFFPYFLPKIKKFLHTPRIVPIQRPFFHFFQRNGSLRVVILAISAVLNKYNYQEKKTFFLHTETTIYMTSVCQIKYFLDVICEAYFINPSQFSPETRKRPAKTPFSPIKLGHQLISPTRRYARHYEFPHIFSAFFAKNQKIFANFLD